MEGIWLFDPDTKQVLESNAAFQEMLGYTAEELQEMTNYDFVTHTREDIDSAVQQVVQERRGYFGERKYRRKDGMVLDVEVSGTVIPYKGKEVLCGVARDLTERKRAEEKLKESEERFRSAFEDAPIGVALVDLDGRRFRVNRALCEVLGYSEEELLDKEYLEDIHPEDHEISSKHLRRTLEGGPESYTLERRYIHADGHTVWNLSSVSLIRDSQGNPSYFVCLHQDITERKEVERKLRESEASLAEAQRIAHLGNWELDAKTGEMFWSDEVFRIYGYQPREFVPTYDKLLEGAHPDDRELTRKNIDGALYEGEPYDFEHRIVRSDGEERVVRCQAEVLFDEEEGEPLRMIGTIHDITEQKEAEKALRESELLLRTVIGNVPIILFALDNKGVITLSEGKGLESLGFKPNEMVGQSVFDVYRDRPQLLECARRVLDGEEITTTIELDGRMLEVRSSSLRDETGEVSGVIGVAIDVTERKRAEERLWEANRRLEELAVLRADFTAMVAHEIDTPLAVIQGYTDMLAAEKLGPGEQSQALGKIQAEIDMLKALVADARTAAAIEREDFAVDPQQVPVSMLLDDAARFAATLPGNHPLTVENATDKLVWADPQRIGQVLRNLLSNAAKYSPEGAPIELRAKPGQTPGRVRIEVADRGQGIHPDDVTRIFEKFGRGRDRYGRKMTGVGLGLYISRRILQAHGGDLTLNPAPGGGSVFGFELEAVR